MNNNNSIVAVDHSTEIGGLGTVLPRSGFRYDEDQVDEINVSDLVNILRRHKFLIFIITSLIFLLTSIYALSIVPTYRAEATLKIDRQTNKVVSFDIFEMESIDDNFYQTQRDILTSRSLASKVISQVNLDDYNRLSLSKKTFVGEKLDLVKRYFQVHVIDYLYDKAVEYELLKPRSSRRTETITGAETKFVAPIELEFLSHLTVKISKKSSVAHIFFESHDPEFSKQVANMVGDQYIRMSLIGRDESNVYAQEFLKKQLLIAKNKLRKNEEEFVRYAKKNKIITTDDDQSIISSELSGLSQAYIDAQTRLILAESEYREKSHIVNSIRLIDNSVINKLKEKQASLKLKYSELTLIYKPGYPAMIELNNQIKAITKQINIETSVINRGSKNELRTTYLAAKKTADKIRKKLSQKKIEVMALRDKSIGYQALRREVASSRKLYNGLLQRVSEVEVASGAVTSRISFLDRAFTPFKKHKPDTAQHLANGMLLGLVIGIGLAFLIEGMDDTVKSAKDIEALIQLPVIGYFPLTKSKRGKPPLLLYEKVFSPAFEAFRSLAVDLEYSTEDGTPKLLHVTSSSSFEGKTCAAINLAIVLANEGKKVVILDCDLRRPTLHKYLDVDNGNGITDILVGKSTLEEALQSSTVPNLYVLSSGVIPGNPVKLLASQKMIDLLDSLSDKFDQVIMDSPPVLGMADTLILANRAHGTLFVTTSEVSKKVAIADAVQRLRRSHGVIVGVLLTKVKRGYHSYEDYYSYKQNSIAIKMEPVNTHVSSNI